MVKNLPANAGGARDVGSIPGSGRSPGEGNGQPLQYSCLENSTDRGAWWAAVHRAVELEVVLDAVAVRNAEIDAEGSDLAVEQHTAVVGDPGHAIDHEVLERQAYLARKHRVGERELAQHHADAAAQDVGVAEPGILDHDLAVAALLGHDGVEVVGDVLAQRSAGQQLDQIRRLEVG